MLFDIEQGAHTVLHHSLRRAPEDSLCSPGFIEESLKTPHRFLPFFAETPQGLLEESLKSPHGVLMESLTPHRGLLEDVWGSVMYSKK